MNNFFLIFIVYFGSSFMFELAKETLNLKHLSNAIPDEFSGFYNEAKYAAAQSYLKDKTRLHLFEQGFMVLVLLAMIFFQGFNQLDLWARQFQLNEITTGLIFIGSLLLLLQALKLPFSVINTFNIEEKYGFNNTRLKTFLTDRLIALVLITTFGLAFFSIMMLIFQTFSNLAWLVAWGISIALEILLVFILPVLILPLFNKFSPLETGELKTAIEDFAKNQNFQLQGLFTMDGSKRSTKANAFFTGFGKSRRVVLFDTLIKNFSIDELVVILAHEIGHYKKKHIIKQLLLSMVLSGIGFFIFGMLINNELIFTAFNVDNTSIYARFLLVILVFLSLKILLSIITNTFSRINEYEADQYAIEQTGSGDAMINALKNLSVSSLANLSPHPFKVLVDYTHPPVLNRIKALKKLNNQLLKSSL